jgi:hypothetical protein
MFAANARGRRGGRWDEVDLLLDRLPGFVENAGCRAEIAWLTIETALERVGEKPAKDLEGRVGLRGARIGRHVMQDRRDLRADVHKGAGKLVDGMLCTLSLHAL